jgi:hypothetical protein
VIDAQVWCCGGGTQSAAIGAAICSGKLPRPDLAIIVDTGRERSATWEYFDAELYPRLKFAGVCIERVRSDAFTRVQLFDIESSPLLPGFTTLDVKGKLSNYCSGTWKRDVIERWLRSVGVKTCRLWFGISLDEMRRVRRPHRGWIQHYYPIVWELRLRRRGCLALLEALGWPRPPRSACWMCPNAGDEEWLDMKQNWPADFAAAVQLEREMRAVDPYFYLHMSCVPLDQVAFADGSVGEDAGCNTAFCFT